MKSLNALFTSSALTLSPNFTHTASVCPSITGTRWQEAQILNAAFFISFSSSVPRILSGSLSILSSSCPINGITLSSIAIEGKPAYPAPDTACMVATRTSFIPNLIKGFKLRVITIAEQLGFVIMNPSQPRNDFCTSINAKWSAFISGIISGTSFSILCTDTLLETAYPACAHFFSTSRAIDPGRAENITATSSFPATPISFMDCTTSSAASSGISYGRTHFATSRYLLPALLSEAKRAPNSNQGCPSKSCTNLCPTLPVAPNIPTFIFSIFYLLFLYLSVKRFKRIYRFLWVYVK
ncbi:hypothetical protein ES705_12849 [subsurface metagenome]